MASHCNELTDWVVVMCVCLIGAVGARSASDQSAVDGAGGTVGCVGWFGGEASCLAPMESSRDPSPLYPFGLEGIPSMVLPTNPPDR